MFAGRSYEHPEASSRFFKRGMFGVYQALLGKHLHRYLASSSFAITSAPSSA